MFALTKIGEKAVPPLINRISQLIEHPEKDEFGEDITINFTLGALAEIKDEKALNFLISLAKKEEFISDVNNATMLALNMGDQKDPRLMPFIREIMERHKHNNHVVLEARDSIKRIQNATNPDYTFLRKEIQTMSSPKEIFELGL